MLLDFPYLDNVENLFVSMWGRVITCIAYAINTFLTLCLQYKAIQGYVNLGVCTS